jgi:poly-gamma-glutamate system protein
MNPSTPFRKGKISSRGLAILSLFAFLALLLVEGGKYFGGDPLRSKKAAAVSLMQESLRVVKEEKIRKGIAIDPILDPYKTGVIGAEYNDLTTTLGSLSAKRISTHPEFAAVVVDMLGQTRIREGDAVLISFSGSFPALNIAVLSAAKVLGLQAIMVSSVGASQFGANDPELTWLDMERVLCDKGIFPYRSVAASLGGITSTKGGVDGTGISAGLQAIRRNGIPILEEEGESTLQTDIQRRWAIYQGNLGTHRPAAFISVGGPVTSLGNSPEALKIPGGLLTEMPNSHHPERGLIFRMGEKGIPVIHLLGIKKIARQYGIPADPLSPPVPVVAIGVQRGRYSITLGFITLGALLLLLGIGGRGAMISEDRGRSGSV